MTENGRQTDEHRQSHGGRKISEETERPEPDDPGSGDEEDQHSGARRREVPRLIPSPIQNPMPLVVDGAALAGRQPRAQGLRPFEPRQEERQCRNDSRQRRMLILVLAVTRQPGHPRTDVRGLVDGVTEHAVGQDDPDNTEQGDGRERPGPASPGPPSRLRNRSAQVR